VANEDDPLILPKSPFLPYMREQNPAPLDQTGQDAVDARREATNAIMVAFQQVLPSNYVAQVPGPYYWMQFQSAAETLATIQLTAKEVGLQSDVDFARPEFLWQMIGTLVFPDNSKSPQGIPEVDGDLTYREFLRRMLQLLLEGATEDVVEEGLNLLTMAVVQVLAKVDFSGEPTSYWGFPEQHEFEINVLCQTIFTDPATGELIEGALGTGFPADPFQTLRNNLRILRALKPAKALFEYRHLFLDAFGEVFTAVPMIDLDSWYYDDFRKFCCGMKEITSSEGVTLASRILFSDVTRSFGSICEGAILEILDGPNSKPTSGGKDQYRLGLYHVTGVLRFPGGADETPQAYTTSPTGLSGTGVVGDDGVFTDDSQDFSDAVEGEVLTIQGGANAGDYRLETLLGINGGPVGEIAPGSGVTSVRVAPSILETGERMVEAATGQSYRVFVERLGVRIPFDVVGEDASAQFYI
jgi:hypothetical protein